MAGAARNEHYAATKGALNSMTYALAVEFARYGVTVNAILPGWIETDMTRDAMANPKFVGNVMPRIPARRWGQPSISAGSLSIDERSFGLPRKGSWSMGFWRSDEVVPFIGGR